MIFYTLKSLSSKVNQRSKESNNHTVLVRWFIIVGATLSKQCISDLIHGTQAMDNSRICRRLLFHERGKQYFVLLRLNFTLKLWAKFLTLMSVNYAWTYLKRTQLLSAWFSVLSVSSLSLSVIVRSCHACVNLSHLRSLGFTPTLRSGSSLSPTWQRAGHIACTKPPEDVRSSWNI